MSRMKAIIESVSYESSWRVIIRNRFKHLFCELTSFKNLVGLGFIYGFFKYDGLDSWAFVVGMSMFLVFKEAKELLAIWKGNGQGT